MIEIQFDFFSIFSFENTRLFIVVNIEAFLRYRVADRVVTLSVSIEMDGVFGVVN